MAITAMSKVMIVCHRTQVSDLLEALQEAGICQILGADEARISQDAPELAAARERPKDLEELVGRLERGIRFLKEYAASSKGLTSVLAPRPVVEPHSYRQVVSDAHLLKIADRAEQLRATIEKIRAEIDHCQAVLELLRPWVPLRTPLEELGRLESTACWPGLVPQQHFEQLQRRLEDQGAAVQRVSPYGTRQACLVLALREQTEPVQKLLRGFEFEIVNFESMTGTVVDQTRAWEQRLAEIRNRLEEHQQAATALSAQLLALKILHDHYRNILAREETRERVPATEQALILEGWCRQQDYPQLEKLVAEFDAASLAQIEPAAGEEPPVEIENRAPVKPFEVVTRLYGMPQPSSVDPTAWLAPFFAIFFGMCVADVGYGLLMLVVLAVLGAKMQGDKKLVAMLGLCAVGTMMVGALTGGWFGDFLPKFVPHMEGRRTWLWFDPFQQPLIFFGWALVLGYFQLIFGLLIGFVHNLRRRDYVAAAFDQLTWLVLLNSIVLLAFSKTGQIAPAAGAVFAYLAIGAGVLILALSHREGSLGARLGMGFYNVFSTIFYLGDVLSYLRLMALGMVSAGLAMAINVIAKTCIEIPWVGVLVAIVVLVVGHVFNMVLAILSAFVHTLRLQYVEFFPKFLVGGGRAFAPLAKDFEYIHLKKAGS
jgi:V/A-type H+-transporting ATPase subunit I